MSEDEFSSVFKALTRSKDFTGCDPMSWQWRLFEKYFAIGDFPRVIDLPTGLGKTMVMAIWLIAWAHNKSLPRRLVYVVDRRTVVDQATDLAILLRENAPAALPCITKLAVSTLRGQLADNREWSRDLSTPAIIIGTVDLIGSGLLFSGYRSSYKRRPLEAGLLGQDSLIVLDEAHLSRPFEKLLTSISEFQANQGSAVGVIRMSATAGSVANDKELFVLDTDENSRTYDLKPNPDPATGKERNQIVRRFDASKSLRIEPPIEPKKLNAALANAAIRLADDPSVKGKRMVVFVRLPEDAKQIANIIRTWKTRTVQQPDADAVMVLTGTMRGFERDELVRKNVFKHRWLSGELDPQDPPNQDPVFLISTSAGEVGFDLNADHMVSDQTTIDSFIQRLGRVNRRGTGKATIILIPEQPKEPATRGKQVKTDPLARAIMNTLALLDGHGDVSPKNIDSLKEGPWKDPFPDACAPSPTTVELTDVLLDAWSMTSITEPMPGRPEVGPWLRGIEKEQAETSIAWRAELELFSKQADSAKALKAVFAKHRVRAHECLTTYSYRAAEFLEKAVRRKVGRPGLLDTALAIRLPRGQILIRTVRQLVEDSSILYAEPTLILPATFGGLDEAGMLSADAIASDENPGDKALTSLDVADQPGYEQQKDGTPRLRLVIRRTDGGNWVPESLPYGINLSDRLVLGESFASSTLLVAALRNARKVDGEESRLRIRLVQPVERDDDGKVVRSLVLLTPVGDRTTREDQSLAEHVEAVEKRAEGIADRLELKGSLRDSLLFAAHWHDEGKKADVWQRFVYGKHGEYKGKSSETRDPKSLAGYRHEFGSLLRLHHPGRHSTDCALPPDDDTCDIALHLIATHHGFGRPHFDNATDRDFQTGQCSAAHADAIRRFARLQRKYGWWRLAWLENLLRCADALASADDVSEDDVGERIDERGEHF